MRVIEIAKWIFLFFPGIVSAAVDPKCLKHLGGAFADVECYNSLSNNLEVENKRLIRDIAVTIPIGNPNQTLLTKYQQEASEYKKYCELSRDSLTEWVSEKAGGNPRYFYYDVAYYQCIYENLVFQNRFLKELRNNVRGR
jgi:hypothetical protein